MGLLEAALSLLSVFLVASNQMVELTTPKHNNANHAESKPRLRSVFDSGV